MSATIIPAPPTQPLPYGLFSVVSPRIDNEVRFEAGAIFEDFAREALDLTAWSCEESAGPTPESLVVVSPESVAFIVSATFLCSPVGWSVQRAYDAALSRLRAGEEAAVENALWSGVATPSFKDISTTLQASTPLEALALAEQSLATLTGGLGILHVSRYAATVLAKEARLTNHGGRLLTSLGTPVVVSAYYADEPEESQVVKIVGTPNMSVLGSEVIQYSSRPGDLFDRGRNELAAVASRTYTVSFLPENGVIVEVASESSD